MNYKTRLLVFISVLAALYSTNIFAQPNLYIKKGIENYSLGKYISILEDKKNKLNIYQASSDSMKNKYVYYNNETVNLRFTLSAHWLRFVIVDTLSNPASNIIASQNSVPWILVKNEPLIEYIDLYYRDSNTGKYIEINAGTVIPVRYKIIKLYDFIGAFPVQKNIPDTVYLRVKTNSQFIISFNMLTMGEYVIRSSKRNFFHGGLFGILFLLMAYNTLLYFSIKDKVYILYVLYILCFTIFIFTYEGYYFDIIGRTFDRDYIILPMSALSLTGVFWLLLTREFLSTKLCFPRGYKLLTYITPLAPITFICAVTFTLPWLAAFWAACILGYYIVGLVVAVITLKKGIYISRYYLLALSGMIFGIFIIFLTRNGILPMPYNFWTQNAVNLGILWEALILAATVGYRFNLLSVEKEKEKALIRNQIAADLHDEIGSNLSAISLQSRMMLKSPKLDDNSKKQIQGIANITSITTDKIRDIVWFINPFHDKSEDLLIRMKELASKMLINLDYEFIVKPNNENIFDSVSNLNKRRHLYLIFKEVLNNIVKHSLANKVDILLSLDRNKFLLIISDDGKGFNEVEIIKGEGLRNLKSRAKQSDAQIFIESKVDKGTKITLEIPLNEKGIN